METVKINIEKTIETFNAKHIVSVTLQDKRICFDFNYVEAKPAKWFSKATPAGYSHNDGWETKIYSEEELKTGKFNKIKFLVINSIVFYKPCITIEFSSGKIVKQIFDDYNDALKSRNDLVGLLDKQLLFEANRI